jgi:hypothetical protein
MRSTLRLDIGLSLLLRCVSPLVTDRETRTHRRGRSKRSYGHCRRRTDISEAEPLAGTPPGYGRLSRRPRLRVSRKTRPVMCRGDGASTGTPAAPALGRKQPSHGASRRCRSGRNAVVRAAADLTPAFRGGASVGRAEPPDHEPLSLQRARQPIRRLRLLRAAPRRIQGGSTASTWSSRSRALCPRIIAAVQSGPVTDAHHVVASYWSAVISCAPLVRQSDQHTAKCSSDVATLRRRIPGPRRGRIKHRTDVKTGRVTGLVPIRRPSRIGANIGF